MSQQVPNPNDVTVQLHGVEATAHAGTLEVKKPRHYVLHAESGKFEVKGSDLFIPGDPAQPHPKTNAAPRISLSGLDRLICDVVPTPRLRNRLRKQLAEEGAHIADLQADGRHRAAKWQWFCAYVIMMWEIVGSPAVAIAGFVGRVFRQS